MNTSKNHSSGKYSFLSLLTPTTTSLHISFKKNTHQIGFSLSLAPIHSLPTQIKGPSKHREVESIFMYKFQFEKQVSLLIFIFDKIGSFIQHQEHQSQR